MKYALLIVSLVFSGCGRNGSLPRKPEVANCIVIESLGLSACFNNQTGEEYDVPFEDMNKYVCFSPGHWTLTLAYIRLLERYKTTGFEAAKFRKSYESNKMSVGKRN